jgi:hypothetical protein
MNTGPENSKLVELRSKTDRELIQLITRKLEAAACVADIDGFHGPVASACDEVRRLLPFVPRADRRRLEARLRELGHTFAQAACF